MGLDADRVRVLLGSAPPTTIAPQVFARFQIMANVYSIYVHRDGWIDTSVTVANGSENASGKRTNERRVRQVLVN